MTDPAIIEAAARALRNALPDVVSYIEAAALERAARVAADYYHPGAGNNPYAVQRDIAAAIRALIVKDSGGGGR